MTNPQAPDFNDITKEPLPADFNSAVVRVLEELLAAVNNLDHRINKQDESLRHPNGYYLLLNRISALKLMVEDQNAQPEENDGSNSQYSSDDVESLIRTKLQRALATEDSVIAKRATRNVQKFIMELARLAGKSVAGGAVSTPIALATTKDEGLKPASQGTQPKRVQEVVDMALDYYSQVYERDKADGLVEKLRQEKYPV